MKPFFRIFTALAFIALALPAAAQAPATPVVPVNKAAVAPAPAIPAAAGILVDLKSDKILWAHNDDVVRAPASLTKILTALVVLENARLDDTATVTGEARAAPGSRTYVEEGWTFTVNDLLWGLLLKSGNDSAIALAQKVSPDGTVDGFMKLANARAVKLGAKNTHFMNPHGYDQPGHVTTARDLAIITVAAMRNPIFAEMVGSSSHRVAWGNGQTRLLTNHNKLLTRYPGAKGIKTGFTNNAGHSLASAAGRGDETLAAITLGSTDHYAEAISLYDWGFANLPALRARSTTFVDPAKRLTPAPVPAPAAEQDFFEKAFDALAGLTGSASLVRRLATPLYISLGIGVLLAMGFTLVMTMRWRRVLRGSRAPWLEDVHLELYPSAEGP